MPRPTRMDRESESLAPPLPRTEAVSRGTHDRPCVQAVRFVFPLAFSLYFFLSRCASIGILVWALFFLLPARAHASSPVRFSLCEILTARHLPSALGDQSRWLLGRYFT
ncbi:hypothetical protein [Pandoravirus japonicus]|uniref:Transmembrane protein n=1 Tax=Pandoravirus japonicus TaxID=2823154 RepID=A0A811BT01_9VIRU|nr:hypothetical protein [Pandoravirus japonicus]